MSGEKRLWGTVNAEEMYTDEQSAVEHAVDLDYCRGVERRAGDTFTVIVEEWSVLPPGETPGAVIPSGAEIVDSIIERWGEDCGMEDLYEQMSTRAQSADVVAAFQAARDLLVSKQTYLVANERIATHRYRITITTDDGGWDWEPEGTEGDS